jgi:hypothetical protein
MKNTIMFLMAMLFTGNAFALNCGETQTKSSKEESSVDAVTDMPKYMKGMTITLTKADGSTEVLKSEEFMVVKRKHKRPVTKETIESKSLTCKDESVKDIVSLKAVDGYSDVKAEQSVKTTTLKVERQLGLGLQYQHALNKKVYVGGEVDTNRGMGVMVGIGF